MVVSFFVHYLLIVVSLVVSVERHGHAVTHADVILIKGAIISKIIHAIKLKTSPARLAQLLQPSLAFCLAYSQ